MIRFMDLELANFFLFDSKRKICGYWRAMFLLMCCHVYARLNLLSSRCCPHPVTSFFGTKNAAEFQTKCNSSHHQRHFWAFSKWQHVCSPALAGLSVTSSTFKVFTSQAGQVLLHLLFLLLLGWLFFISPKPEEPPKPPKPTALIFEHFTAWLKLQRRALLPGWFYKVKSCCLVEVLPHDEVLLIHIKKFY